MKTVGIICECNPFHGGHQYLIDCARRDGADCIIGILSGNLVQRADVAVADRFLRAEALLCGGADLVLELPFPYAAAGAEFFAGAGVEILDRLGVDELWFGSECGDLALLSEAAAVCESPEFLTRYAQTDRDPSGTAKAYFSILEELCPQMRSISSNDILGIAYLRALDGRRSDIRPITVLRQGSAYRDSDLATEGFPSATALRREWRQRGLEAVLPHLPASCRAVYARAEEPADLRYAERFVLGHFRTVVSQDPEAYAELAGGLGERMAHAAGRASDLESFLQLCATKKYPASRIRRAMLFALTGVRPHDLRMPIAYTRLLAANGIGRAFLSQARRSDRLPIVTRKTDLPQTEDSLYQQEMEKRAWDLWTLCLPQTRAATDLWKGAPVMRQ